MRKYFALMFALVSLAVVMVVPSALATGGDDCVFDGSPETVQCEPAPPPDCADQYGEPIDCGPQTEEPVVEEIPPVPPVEEEVPPTVVPEVTDVQEPTPVPQEIEAEVTPTEDAYNGPTPPLGIVTENVPQGQVVAASPATTLPYTGLELTFALIGIALVGTGFAVWRLTSRRKTV